MKTNYNMKSTTKSTKITKAKLTEIVKCALHESGGMRYLHATTRTGAIAKRRAKAAAAAEKTPEEKEQAEKERLARLAKFGHLYADQENTDQEEIEEEVLDRA